MDFCQLVAHSPFELAHPQLSSGRECHMSTSHCIKNHLVLLTLPGFYNKRPPSEDSEHILPLSVFPVTHTPFVDLCQISITSAFFPAGRVLDYTLACLDCLHPGLPPLPVAQGLHSGPGWDTDVCPGLSASSRSCPGSSRSWVTRDVGGLGSRGEPGADRALADQVQSHHV